PPRRGNGKDRSLGPWTLGLEPDAPPERRRPILLSVRDYEPDAAKVRDVGQRIAFHHEQVGPFSRCDSSTLSPQPQRFGRLDRRGLNRLHRRESGSHVELELPMETIPGHDLVRAGHDADAGPVQDVEHGEKVRKRFGGTGLPFWGNTSMVE